MSMMWCDVKPLWTSLSLSVGTRSLCRDESTWHFFLSTQRLLLAVNIRNRAVKNKNKGKYRTQTKYRKIQDSYKNTGINRIYRTGGNTQYIVMPKLCTVSTTLTSDDNTDTCQMLTCSVWNLKQNHNTWDLEAGFSHSRRFGLVVGGLA